MRRALPFTFVSLSVIIALALAGPSAAMQTGRITFSGHIIDANTTLVPGSVVTVQGAVIARSDTCIETHVTPRGHAHAAMLWLCSSSRHAASQLPDVGKRVAARARITGVKVTAAGAAARSDSFILLDVD